MRRQRPRGLSGRRLLAGGVMAAAVAVSMAACGSTSSSSSSSSTTATPAAATSSGSANSAASSAGPITIGVGATVIPGVYDAKSMYDPAVKAALGYISAHGGWGGRQVKTIDCASPGTPAADTTCYRQFISSHVLAVMGIMSGSATIGYPLLSKVGIPSFMIGAARGDDLSPWENNISGSGAATFTSAARYACATGVKSVSVLRDDDSFHQQSFDLFAKGILKSCGIALNEVPVPYGAADLAPYVTKAVSTHPDLLFAIHTAAGTAEVDAIASAGYPSSNVLIPAFPSQQFLSDHATNGMILMTGWEFPIPQNDNPDVQTYLQAMKQYSPGADPGAQLSFPGFQDVMAIWDASKAIGFDKVTGRSLQQYMNTQAPGHLQIFGSRLVETVPGAPGIKQPYTKLWRWQDGKLTNLGWWQANTACTSQASCKAGYAGT